MWGAFENLLAFLLGDATQDAKAFALSFQLLVIRQAMENLLLGFVANRAGVVEDEVRLIHGLNLAVAFRHERADDFFRVMHVHLAAEGFEVKSLAGAHTHTSPV